MYFRLLNTEVGNKYKHMMKYTLIKIEQIQLFQTYKIP